MALESGITPPMSSADTEKPSLQDEKAAHVDSESEMPAKAAELTEAADSSMDSFKLHESSARGDQEADAEADAETQSPEQPAQAGQVAQVAHPAEPGIASPEEPSNPTSETQAESRPQGAEEEEEEPRAAEPQTQADRQERKEAEEATSGEEPLGAPQQPPLSVQVTASMDEEAGKTVEAIDDAASSKITRTSSERRTHKPRYESLSLKTSKSVGYQETGDDPCREFDSFAGEWVDSKLQTVKISPWGVICYPKNPKLRFEADNIGPNHIRVTFDKDPNKRQFVGRLNHDCNMLVWSNDTRWIRKDVYEDLVKNGGNITPSTPGSPLTPHSPNSAKRRSKRESTCLIQ